MLFMCPACQAVRSRSDRALSSRRDRCRAVTPTSRPSCWPTTIPANPGTSGAAPCPAAATGRSSPKSWRTIQWPTIPVGSLATSWFGPCRTSMSGSCSSGSSSRRPADPYPPSVGGAWSSSSSPCGSWSPTGSSLGWWSTISRTSMNPNAARSRRRAASWSGSTCATPPGCRASNAGPGSRGPVRSAPHLYQGSTAKHRAIPHPPGRAVP
jgi:hypothetical protein